MIVLLCCFAVVLFTGVDVDVVVVVAAAAVLFSLLQILLLLLLLLLVLLVVAESGVPIFYELFRTFDA